MVLRPELLQLLFKFWHNTMFTFYIFVEFIYMSNSVVPWSHDTTVALHALTLLRKEGPHTSFFYHPSTSFLAYQYKALCRAEAISANLTLLLYMPNNSLRVLQEEACLQSKLAISSNPLNLVGLFEFTLF